MASESVAGVMHGDVMLMNATSEFDPHWDSPAWEKSRRPKAIFRLRLNRDHNHD
jgi:hypothetical protein